MSGILLRCARWLKEKTLRKVRNAILRVLAAGPIPQHVGFVMDGNRRYARQRHLRVQEGHSSGSVALQRVLEICFRLSIKCVTVYAFAIDNFKRSEEEVDALMNLAEAKLTEICQHGQLLDQYGVRLNILGRTELLPKRIYDAVRQAEDMTRHNDRAVLNICMPYSARDDIATAVRTTVQHALDERSSVESITEENIEANLMTTSAGSPPLDILVRTSGVKRLSDFLLWQCTEDTQLQFSTTYWPDFGLRQFGPILLDFQRKVWAERASGRVRAGVSRSGAYVKLPDSLPPPRVPVR